MTHADIASRPQTELRGQEARDYFTELGKELQSQWDLLNFYYEGTGMQLVYHCPEAEGWFYWAQVEPLE